MSRLSLVDVHVRPLGTAAEVLVATAHDPFARGTLRRPLARGWLTDGATAWLGIDNEERRAVPVGARRPRRGRGAASPSCCPSCRRASA